MSFRINFRRWRRNFALRFGVISGDAVIQNRRFSHDTIEFVPSGSSEWQAAPARRQQGSDGPAFCERQPAIGFQQNRSVQIRQTPKQPVQNGNFDNAAHPAPPQAGAVQLSGRIGRYFAVKQTSTGKSLATFSLATVKPYRDESGNWTKQTVSHRVVAWGQTAELLSAQLEKGVRVSVEGKFKTREWVDRENNLRSTTELIARQVHFLDAAAA